jgi:membrane-associated protein
MPFIFDLFLHLDKYLGNIISEYGTFTYVLLLITLFCETGLVVTPFLPGDSLLFAAGTFAAIGALDLPVLLLVLYCGPILGDSSNYWIGRFIGPKIFSRENVRFLNRKNLEKTHAFYEKHGGKAVIIARFMPIFRTFVPFIAGIGKMNYLRFLSYSVVGTLLWITALVLLGYFFGNIPVVKKNFSIAILAVIAISMLPGVIEYLKHRREQKLKAKN